jgi:hypothetical protein
MRMRLLYCHLWLAWFYDIFPHYFLNGLILGKVIEYKMCVLSSSATFVRNISYFKKNAARYCHKLTCLDIKYPLFLSDFNETWIFSTGFRNKKYPSRKFLENRPVGAELLHAGGRADGHAKASSWFSGFCERAWRRYRCSLLSYNGSTFDLPVCVGTDWKRSRYRRKERARAHARTHHVSFTWFQGTKYRYAPHNDVSVNDRPHIRRWSHNIIIYYITTVLQLLTIFSTVTCCTGL